MMAGRGAIRCSFSIRLISGDAFQLVICWGGIKLLVRCVLNAAREAGAFYSDIGRPPMDPEMIRMLIVAIAMASALKVELHLSYRS
jgi:hypothetical protein